MPRMPRIHRQSLLQRTPPSLRMHITPHLPIRISHAPQSSHPTPMQTLQQPQRNIDRKPRIRKLRQSRRLIAVDSRPILRQRQSHPRISCHIAIGKMVNDPPNIPSPSPIRSIELRLGQARNRLRKFLRQRGQRIQTSQALLHRKSAQPNKSPNRINQPLKFTHPLNDRTQSATTLSSQFRRPHPANFHPAETPYHQTTPDSPKQTNSPAPPKATIQESAAKIHASSRPHRLTNPQAH